MTKPFLHASEDGLVVACLQINDPIGRKACLSERGRKEIRAENAPQNLAGGSCRYAGGEQSGGCAIDRAVSAAGNFMNCALRQAPTGESRVHLGNPEGEHRFHAPAFAFDLLDLRAQ